MARIIALDYGKVRTGIAVTDALQFIASGLTTVASQDLLSFLSNYVEKEAVERFVVGLPKRMNNTPSECETFIQPFLKKLAARFPSIPIERHDERFTSKMAFQSMITSGVRKKKRKNKALIDEISATLILQGYLKKT